VRRVWSSSAAALVLLATSACAPAIVTHGHQIEERRVAAIRPGVTSRDEVARLLGTPSSIATFDDQNWYYISQRHERANFFQQDMIGQDVVKVTFDDRGLVESVDQRGMETAMAIDPDPDQTRTLGNELSIIEQFIGNIGRFNPEGVENNNP
jgi:outer membrane protein assembly factor BamE (lipoprotein component of BamABCDE complex)